MKRFCELILLTAFVALSLTACGNDDDDDNGTGPTPVTRDTLYVDVENIGTEDGTAARPYNTLTEAVAAASEGDLLLIAAGEYAGSETFPIFIKAGMTLQGVHADSTLIRGSIRDTSLSDSRPWSSGPLLRGILVLSPQAPAATTATNLVRRCTIVGDIQCGHAGGYNLAVDSCVITGHVHFAHGSGNSKDALRYSTVNGTVFFGSAVPDDSGQLVQVIAHCHVTGAVAFESGAGATDTILGCEIDSLGIIYHSGSSEAYIAFNVIYEGQIYDHSGYGAQVITHNTVTCTGAGSVVDSACIWCEGAGDQVTHNTLFAHDGVHGIYTVSGAPTILDSNTIRVTGGGMCVYTQSGMGQVVGNTLTGGSYGIVDSSGALLVAYNEIDSCGIGASVHSGARYLGNSITNCTGDGLIVDYTGHAVDSNTITDNGGAGIRAIDYRTDFGGGQHNGLGGNVIQRNGGWDFVNETGDTIWAKFNLWDHADSASIDGLDIYDDDDDGGLGPVIFVPIGDL